MGKKEVTRQEKFENYRNSIEEATFQEENTVKSSELKAKNKQPRKKVKPIVLDWMKKKRKKLFWYYFCISLFAIITIIVLVYFGVKIYG